MITISYVNFWRDPRNDRWLSRFIDHNIGQTREVHHTDNPDILVCSCLGPLDNTIKQIKSGCKIFFTGENPERYKPYDNFELLRQYFDLLAGFRPGQGDADVVRFPHWLIYHPAYDTDCEHNIVDVIERAHNSNKNLSKDWFATIVSRPNRAKISRDIIYNELSKHGKVMAPAGALFGNTNIRLGPGFDDKIQFIKKGQYHICPENSSYPGYVTEKIFHAAQAGTIPIYWGHSSPEIDIINSKKYCFVDINSAKNAQAQVLDCVNNPDKYIDGPFFTTDAKEHIQKMYDNLTNTIQRRLA